MKTSLPWESAGWLDSALPWLDAALASHGLRRAAAPDLFHTRPWSAVARIALRGGGTVYFKAAAPVLAHEAALTAALAAWYPRDVPPVLAADPARAWLLLGDCGRPLRSYFPDGEGLALLEKACARFGQMQVELSARLAELERLGAYDRRLAGLPGQVEDLLDDADALMIGQPDGLSAEQAAAARGLLPRYRALCAELAATAIPASLHHDDLHDGNFFVEGGQVRITDWGETALAHPFNSLLITLRAASDRLDCAEDDPRLLRVRDAYLEAWSAGWSRADLRRAFALAWVTAMPARALTWRRVIRALGPGRGADYAAAVPGWVGEWLGEMEKWGD